jgi:aminoglycoside phosphotransferase (APT) family kinase protein
MNRHELLAHLHEQGLISSPNASCTELKGGVSSDIWLIDDGQKKLVVKRALPKLRVPQDWYADVSRNRHEQEYLDYVARFLPDAVPRLIHRDPSHGFFVMEYLGPEFANWKTLLLAGQAVPAHAIQAGRILGSIHRRSWNDPEARARFATTPQFYQLRIDPYLLTTGRRHARLQSLFQQEADRLATAALCLVHGDFSPKNILLDRASSTDAARMVLLDCEVAWFGDPAFDVAFFLNHLFLKALLFRNAAEPFLSLADLAWRTYSAELAPDQQAGLEERVCRLLLMLLLARVDGKSPVEYLTENRQRETVRTFVAANLPASVHQLRSLLSKWQEHLRENSFNAFDRC